MRVKVFRAATLRAAISLLREELGADALLLSSRETEEGVEVTAAIEPPDDAADDLERFDEVPAPALPAWLVTSFVWHNLPPALVDALSPRLGEQLADSCARRFVFRPLPQGASSILLCGPAGAGKTTAIAALAARAIAAGQEPMVVTADTSRPGAAEHLAAATRALGLMLIVADRPDTMARALARRAPGTPLLIDTPALDAYDAAAATAVEALRRAADATAALVMPAGTDPLEAAEYAAAVAASPLEVDRLMITRLTTSGRLGGPLAACVTGGLALSDACQADGLMRPSRPGDLAGWLAARRPARSAPQAVAAPERRVPPAMSAAGPDPQPLAAPAALRQSALFAAHIAAQKAER